MSFFDNNEVTFQPALGQGTHKVKLTEISEVYMKDEQGNYVADENGNIIVKGYNLVWTSKSGSECRDYRSCIISEEKLKKWVDAGQQENQRPQPAIFYAFRDLAKQIYARTEQTKPLTSNQIKKMLLDGFPVSIEIKENPEKPDMPNVNYPLINMK